MDELREAIVELFNDMSSGSLGTYNPDLAESLADDAITLITTKRAEWERAIGERWFQYLINEVGYEKARQYKDIEALKEGK